MGGIEDYIKWRGDLTFEQSAFNEVDNLVLSQIAYVDFKNIIPAAGSKEKITLRQAAHDFFDLNDDGRITKVTSFIREAPFFSGLQRKAGVSGYCAFRLCRCDR